MQAISIAAMRQLEAEAMAQGVASFTLMERAGIAAARIIDREARRRNINKIAILCGGGNNGGDGIVVANTLKGFEVELYVARPISELKGDVALHAENLPPNVTIFPLNEIKKFPKDTLIVDGLLGTGFSGELRPEMAKVIEAVNSSQATVVALDIPSGLNGDSGVATLAVRADITITFGLPKIGLFGVNGAAYTGIIYVDNIGIAPELLAKTNGLCEVTTQDDVDSFLPKLRYDDYKNSRGRVVIAGGSKKYSGAPLLAALGAMRSGAGFVRMVSDTIPYAQIPAALLIHSDEDLDELFPQVDAIVAGMGWGCSERSYKLLKTVLAQNIPTVLDADALNLLSKHSDLEIRNSQTILTPHLGEAQRLFSAKGIAMPSSRIEAATLLAKLYKAVVVWKGPQSIVANTNGDYAINSNGTPALGVCGSGDVLAGAIGAFAAMGLPPYTAARVGVFIHGKAGDVIPHRGLIADDLLK